MVVNVDKHGEPSRVVTDYQPPFYGLLQQQQQQQQPGDEDDHMSDVVTRTIHQPCVSCRVSCSAASQVRSLQ